MRAMIMTSLSAFVIALFILSMLATSTIAFDTLQIVDTIILDKIPTCIAINEETNLLYVGVPDALLVIDGDSHNIVVDIPLEMDDIIRDIEVNPQTNRIYVAYRPRGGPNKIVVFDGTTNQPIGEMIESIYDQYQIAINPATNFIYIADPSYLVGSHDSIDRYSGYANQQLGKLVIPGSNETIYREEMGIAVNSNTNRIFFTWSGDDTLRVIDGETFSIIKAIPLSSFSINVHVNPYTNYVYVGDLVFDGETYEEAVSNYTGYLRVIDPVNNLLYTTDWPDTLYVLDGTTHNVLTSLELLEGTSIGITGVSCNSKTGRVYVIFSQENQIVVVPEFPSWTPILIMLIAVVVVAVIFRRRLPTKNQWRADN